ncbi:hypothetical protein Tco_1111453 [Tanacetum coccineum]|uniref:Uncharacterized protein n=1 Tax=Tanacetum coccineum TaxID=301880 RepID=A0ABQ5IN52_9ASTR
MSVEDLVVIFVLNEDNKLGSRRHLLQDGQKELIHLFVKANMVEHAGSSSRSNSKGKGKYKRNNYKKSKGKSEYLAPKAGIMKKKFQET